MSKSVLVMDTPKMCMGCPFAWPVDDYSFVCIIAYDEDGDCKAISDDSYGKKVEDWCPLKPLPEKMKVTGIYNGEYFKAGGKPPSYKIGWNGCIDEITGGNVDD